MCVCVSLTESCVLITTWPIGIGANSLLSSSGLLFLDARVLSHVSLFQMPLNKLIEENNKSNGNLGGGQATHDIRVSGEWGPRGITTIFNKINNS